MPYDIEAERRQEREAYAVLVALTEEIAVELGDGWTVDPERGEYTTWLNGPDGEDLQVYCGDLKHAIDQRRLAISARFTLEMRRAAGRLDRAQITCAMSRGAKAIAGEITRRVLPSYRAELKRGRAALISAKTDAQLRETLAAELLALLPKGTSHRDGELYHWGDSGRVKLSISNTASTVSVDLSVDPDTAKAILALVYRKDGSL